MALRFDGSDARVGRVFYNFIAKGSVYLDMHQVSVLDQGEEPFPAGLAARDAGDIDLPAVEEIGWCVLLGSRGERLARCGGAHGAVSGWAGSTDPEDEKREQ